MLGELDISRFVGREPNAEQASSTLPFNLDGHSCARTAVAKDLLQRLVMSLEKPLKRLNKQHSVAFLCQRFQQAEEPLALFQEAVEACPVLSVSFNVLTRSSS